MRRAKSLFAILSLLVVLSGQAMAINLNTTSQWRAWQSDYRTCVRLQNSAQRAIGQRTSAGYRQAARLYDQISNIHLRNAGRFEALSSSSDRALANQAAYQVRGRYIHANQYAQNAQAYRRIADQMARRGR